MPRGGVPREILYDRMKTAVIGEGKTGGIIYNRALLDLARRSHCSALQGRARGTAARTHPLLPSLLIVGEIGYLPVIAGGGNLFFQLVNAVPRAHEIRIDGLYDVRATAMHVQLEAVPHDGTLNENIPLNTARRRIEKEQIVSTSRIRRSDVLAHRLNCLPLARDSSLARISHDIEVHRGSESGKILLLQRLT